MTTKDDCIKALREAAEILGESPTKAQYEQVDITPSASTILRHCGGWNDAKEQAELETSYSTGSRVQEKPDDVELPDGLEWEGLSQDQRWHYKNREHNIQRSLDRRRRLRIWVNEQKQERGCEECGADDPTCLDLHHQDATEKLMKVSKMVTFGYSKEHLRSEMEKCTVLCANCHRKDRAQTPNRLEWLQTYIGDSWHTERTMDDVWVPEESDLQRVWVHRFKQLRGCSRCGETDAVCLDFHHTGEREQGLSISELITNGCSATELRAELNKCEVLCANCHRREHYPGPDDVLSLSEPPNHASSE